MRDVVSCLNENEARIIPVEPPIVNINKKRSPKNAEVLLDNAINPRYQQIRALMLANLAAVTNRKT